MTAAAATLTAFALMVISSPIAKAVEPGFKQFEMRVSSTQAGGHPDLTIDAEWETTQFEPDPVYGEVALRRFLSHTPTGFIGNPHVAPKCTLAEYTIQNCPVDSQVGIVNLPSLGIFGVFFPLYNMETRPDQAGLLAFTTPLLSTPVFLELVSRTDSDYGLSAITSPQIRFPIPDFETILWGVPASPVHDIHRFFTPLKFLAACLNLEEGCPGETFAPAAVPQAPFLQNPTECGVPLTGAAEIEYYGGIFVRAEAPFPSTTGCNQLSFDPAIAAKPTTNQTDAPSGVDINLKVPQTQSPTTPSPSELRTSKVTLPEGLTINPGAADGKVACKDSETSIGTLFAANCPEFAKIGTVILDVAALPGPIPGALYLGEPKPGDPYRVVLTADGFATHVKITGSVKPDPQSGQVTIVFEDLPQSPMQEFDLHVFGSERGLFATPPRCGQPSVRTEFVPWNGNLSTRESIGLMNFDSGPNGAPCPGATRPFEPSLRAGVANNTAGEHTSFSLNVARDDGDQNMTRVDVTAPPGFAATLRDVPYCPESAIALLSDSGYSGVAEQSSPACPAASQIGTAVTGAGAGTHPVYTPGKVYLAGPYGGAPLSLVVAVPALSGPYDLGTVAVRSAVQVDPVTAQVRTVSDALPRILDGIPIRLRSILVQLDRPSFTVNPTNCDPFSVDADVHGEEGALAHESAHFQVANCAELDYGPKLSLRLSSGLKRRDNPAIRAVLRTNADEANTRRVAVTLPRTGLLDNSHIETICTRVDFAREACPEGSRIGNATASSPLLEDPLKGPVYLRASSNKLPDMVVDLEGQIDIELAGRVDSVRGRLRTTFEKLPDTPVDTFVLNLQGGSKGLLINSRNLCRSGVQRARVNMTGQNGARSSTLPKLQMACGKRAKRSRHHRRLQTLRAVR
jgi:hypothetical protein